MNHILGKIFLLATALACCLFLVLTVAVFHTHTVWKRVVKHPQPDSKYNRYGLEVQLELDNARHAQLRAEKDRRLEDLAVERAAAREALSEYESQLDQVEDQYAQREDELAKLTANQVKNAQVLAHARDTMDQVDSEVKAARELLLVTRQDFDAQFDTRASLATQIANVETQQRAVLSEEGGIDKLAALSDSQRNVMDKLGVTVFTNLDKPPPTIRGEILGVNDNNLVEVSFGSDDGLQLGHELDVYRDNVYVGRIVVRRLFPEKSVAEVLKDYRRGPIRRGDRVATKFN